MSHPLQRPWTLWYDSPSTYSTTNWELSLIPIMTVHTVEEFFAMLRYMKPLHALRTSSQYHFFQEGVKPMWEDGANKKGGKVWVNIEVSKADSLPANGSNGDAAGGEKTELDTMWEAVLMALIGEYLEDENDSVQPQIMGVVMAKRKYHNRLAIWVRDATATEAIEKIKKRLVKEANLPPSASLVFTKHGEKV